MVEHMDLLALTDFNLVARHGGFGRAARATGRPKATLSRRVAELEAALGLRLLERGVNSLKLTEEGRALHQRTWALLAEVDETVAEEDVPADDEHGHRHSGDPLKDLHKVRPLLGVGFDYRITKDIALGLEYNDYRSFSTGPGKITTRQVQAIVKYSF